MSERQKPAEETPTREIDRTGELTARLVVDVIRHLNTQRGDDALAVTKAVVKARFTQNGVHGNAFEEVYDLLIRQGELYETSQTPKRVRATIRQTHRPTTYRGP